MTRGRSRSRNIWWNGLHHTNRAKGAVRRSRARRGVVRRGVDGGPGVVMLGCAGALSAEA